MMLASFQATPASSQSQLQPRRATPLGLDEYFPVPESNTLTDAKIALGRRLFFDTWLSVDRTLACASCHQPAHAYSDTVAQSRGVQAQQTIRNAPAILNRAYGKAFFWDGRAGSLEETVIQPIQNPREMGLRISDLVERLRGDSGYRRVFAEEFPDTITGTNIARALASYVRSLRSGASPYDRYMNGDRAALSLEAQEGLRLFTGRANCAVCHVGSIFTDEQFHNTGVSSGRDPGRRAITNRAEDDGKFKVPSLRNVAHTAPYMHDGSMATLDAVIDFYDRGGVRNPSLDAELHALHLTVDEKRALIAFLRSLSGALPEL
jgi:cytochrome c peroxidase